MESSRTVYKGHLIQRNLPKNTSSDDEPLFHAMLEGWSREVKIETFYDVSINNELFIKEGLKFRIMMPSFGDTWQDSVYNRPAYQLKSFVKNAIRKTKRLDQALWCFDQFSTGGYYHWITEITPRLWVASKYVPADLPLLVPSYFLSKWKFALEFLSAFNRKLITFDEREVVHVKKLVFVGQTGGPFNFQPEPISKSSSLLKQRFSSGDHYIKQRKIYISRRNAGKRMILNEADVIPIVQKHGFEVIRTEELNVQQQIQLFSQATDLLSIHGAGLSNMVFMPTGSRILEIRHRDNNHMLNCFFTLAHTCGHSYYYCFGDDKGDSLETEIRPEDKSIHADLNMLTRVLENISAG